MCSSKTFPNFLLLLISITLFINELGGTGIESERVTRGSDSTGSAGAKWTSKWAGNSGNWKSKWAGKKKISSKENLGLESTTSDAMLCQQTRQFLVGCPCYCDGETGLVLQLNISMCKVNCMMLNMQRNFERMFPEGIASKAKGKKRKFA